ncbi:hypothetical protein VTK26DRAFT_2794 [Humicola hyalothermophila]
METLPLKLLGAIALNLPIADLRHFRLLGRRYTDAGFPALVRDLLFLNTLDTADALQTLSRSPYGSLGTARHLTIYDGTWPVALLQEETFLRGPINYQRLPLQQIRWSDLQFCDIGGTWVPENELFGFTEYHSLNRLSLKHVTLTSGSWKSFFSRVRELKPRPNIVCEGILPEGILPSRDSDSFKSQRLLDWFLTDTKHPWPFPDPDEDIPPFSLSP